MAIFNSSYTAPKAVLWDYWHKSNPSSTKVINFNAWQNFLDKYTIEKNNQVYVKYAAVADKDKAKLNQAITQYAKVNILEYNPDQQLAYWINLYNMLTVQVILKHYPIKSITDIDKGWFGSKVWDQSVIRISNKYLTLNDIEHRIIRPIWKNPRTHAALNCASISCPNLSQKAYLGKTINSQLNQAFSNWINSDKGLYIKNNDLYLSKIFDWYGSDFGDKEQMLKFIKGFIKDDSKKSKLNDDAIIYFQNYNWNLNSLK
jgi:hypothetical protein